MKVFSKVKLQEALSDPKLSLSGIAKVLGMDRQSLRAYKLGQKEPRSSALFLIASALGKPVDYFSENISDEEIRQQKLSLTAEKTPRKKVANV